MLYSVAHYLRDKLPWIWDLIDVLNSWLFCIRFGGKFKAVEPEVLERYGKECGMKVVRLCEVPTDELVAFFAAQPDEAFTFFKPHGFEAKSLKKLQRNSSFLSYILMDGSAIAGYCFIRSFFMGKGFRGRMVGIDYRGRGLGTLMNRLMNDVEAFTKSVDSILASDIQKMGERGFDFLCKNYLTDNTYITIMKHFE